MKNRNRQEKRRLFYSTGWLSMEYHKYLCWPFSHMIMKAMRRQATKFSTDATVFREMKTKAD